MLLVIGSTAKEVLGGPQGKKKARNQFLLAVEEAIVDGAKVILLASALKRQWSYTSFMKDVYPVYKEKVLFTIGDNFTSIVMTKEIERVLSLTGMTNPRILIIGPSGFLGSEATRYLISAGYEVVGLAASNERVKLTSDQFGIPIFTEFKDVGVVDLVIAASHFDSVRLSSKNIEIIRSPGKKLAACRT